MAYSCATNFQSIDLEMRLFVPPPIQRLDYLGRTLHMRKCGWGEGGMTLMLSVTLVVFKVFLNYPC